MTMLRLEICEDDPGYWSATSNLIIDGETTRYLVFANSLKQLRDLVQEGVDGAIGIPGLEFEEVFLTNSEVTSYVRISQLTRAGPCTRKSKPLALFEPYCLRRATHQLLVISIGSAQLELGKIVSSAISPSLSRMRMRRSRHQ